MKRTTKAEKIDAYDRLMGENQLLSLAIQAISTEQPDAVERVKFEAESRYTLAAYRLTGPQGGFVSVTFHCKGQNDSVNVYWLDRMLQWREWALELRTAIERIRVTRQNLWDAAA